MGKLSGHEQYARKQQCSKPEHCHWLDTQNMYAILGNQRKYNDGENSGTCGYAAGNLGCPIEGGKNSKEENYEETGHNDEQESEYDTESESELPATVDMQWPEGRNDLSLSYNNS